MCLGPGRMPLDSPINPTPSPVTCSHHCLPAWVLVPLPGVTAKSCVLGTHSGRSPGLQTSGASCGPLVIAATAILGTLALDWLISSAQLHVVLLAFYR